MTLRRDVGIWLVFLTIVGVLLWLLSGILLPFVLGMAIAYVVDPVVVWLERRGISRGAAAGLLVGISFTTGLVVLLVLAPVLVEQAGTLLARAPGILTSGYEAIAPLVRRALAGIGVGPREAVPPMLVQAGERVEAMAVEWAAALLGRGIALVNMLGLLSVTPLVAFYLLRDWPTIVARLDAWLPRDHAPVVRAQAREADRVLAGFARGAALVCTLLMIFYGLALSIAGLDFGLLIGLVAGALSFVPYLGALVGFTASVGMALVQFWPDWTRVAVVGGIFVFGNVVSDYVITPRVVGERIGLHPLWVLFGAFAGAALFGFVGMLVSVPACAVIGVVARFAMAQYEMSAFYRGGAGGV